MTKHPQKALLALLIPALMCHTAQADTKEVGEPKVELEHETINISAKPKEQVGETIVTRRELNEAMVQNAHDLVRYNTEVDVAEVGRYGNKGFAIRGVDGNRVAMDLDGVALPTTEANEVFSPYGYMYEGRFNPDTEILGSVSITAGSDSVSSGSGAMGGAVSYKTKEPVSMVKGDGNLGGYAKIGYTNKNEELLTAVGLAGVYDKAEFLLNYARRDGHELKNHDMRSHDKARMDIHYDFGANGEKGSGNAKSLLYPDPVDYEKDTVLGKFYYHLSDEHRVGLSALYQEQKTNSNAHSKNTAQLRMSKDTEEVKGYGLNYRYQPNGSAWLDQIEANYQYQDVYGLADTYLHSPSANNPYLTQREYRPTQTKTHQLSLDGKFTPIDFGKFGSHRFGAKAIYNHQDYTATMVRLNYASATYPNVGNITQAIQPYAVVLPDAKKHNYSLILTDDIIFNDRLNAKLGVRYDHYKYNPYFQNDTHFGDIRSNEQNEIISNINNQRLKFYADYRNGIYDQKPTFDKVTYSGAFNYEVLPDKLTARYKIGTGFLAPNVTQMYSAFQGLAVKQIINPHLKPETSLNQELEFEFKPTQNTRFTIGGYLSKYDDFIYTRYWENNESVFNEDKYGCAGRNGTCTMSLNLNRAEVRGLKLGADVDLSDKINSKGKFNVFANFHTAKDSAEIQTDKNGTAVINTLAAVPTNFVLGADYVSPAGDWSLHGRMRGILRKKAQDTKTVEVGENATVSTQVCPYGDGTDWYSCGLWGWGGSLDRATGKYVRTSRTSEYYEYVGTYDSVSHSKNVLLFDVYGTKKFGKNQNIILNAGIYNLTDEKYIPWESLRQFHDLTANSMVDRDGYGFNRYTAPGRNYTLSLTYEF